MDDSLIVYMDSRKIWKLFLVLLIIGLTPFTAAVSQVDVLVVDDGHNITTYDEINYEEGMFRSTYVDALESVQGVDADVIQTNVTDGDGLGPSAEKMSEYDAVVWYTLSDRTPGQATDLERISETLTDEDRGNLRTYLHEYGGSLYLTGHRIQFDLGGSDFYKDLLEVEYQESSSPAYYRFEEESSEWRRDWNYEDVGVTGSLGEMQYNEDGDLVLKSLDNSLTGETAFQLNTSVEPAEALGVITDNCNHELDDSEEDEGCNNADEGLRWGNNIEVEGEEYEPDISYPNWNSNSGTTQTLYVGHETDRDRVLVVGTSVTSPEESKEVKSVTMGEQELKELENVANDEMRTQLFYIRNPPEEEYVEVRAGEEVGIGAMAVSFSGLAEGKPIENIVTQTADSDEITAEVESESGDRVFGFVSSTTDLDCCDDKSETEDANPGGDDKTLYGGIKGEEDNEISWEEGEDYIHIAFNLNAKKTDSEYVVETDGEELECSGRWCDPNYPDEHAGSLVQAFQEDFRTVHSSFGFEAIKGNGTRKEFMSNVVRYLTGPVANSTEVTSDDNSDLDHTEVDESKYTDSHVDIDSEGLNLRENPSDVTKARYFYSNTTYGLNPVFETSFENESVFEDRWSIDTEDGGYYSLTDVCGVEDGEKALRLDGDGPDQDSERDDRVEITTGPFDVEGQQDLTLEFDLMYRYHYGEGVPCDGPEADQGEDLEVAYSLPDGGWETRTYENYNPENDWQEESIDIPQRHLHDGLKIRFIKEENDYNDAWVVDDLELDKDMWFYNEDPTVDVWKWVNMTKIRPDLSDYPQGVNVTVGVQYKDGSQQGYWGPMEKDWIQVDTQAPLPPDLLEFSRDYTNERVVNVTLRNSERARFLPDLVRFSCSRNSGEWTKWRPRSDSLEQEFEVNVTDNNLGCQTSQGNRTVYVEVRDYADNRPDQQLSDWIVYDSEKPVLESETPENGSAITSNDTLMFEASDNYVLDDGETTVNIEGDNQSFTPGEAFDPGFGETDSGVKQLEAWIFDRASNFRKVSFRYDLDNNAPGIGISPDNNSSIQSSHSIDFDVFDRNFEALVVNGAVNNTFRSNTTFSPSWNEGASRDLEVWVNDSAGNEFFRNFTFTVDDTSPEITDVKYENGSFVQEDVELGYELFDQLSSIERYVYPGEDVPGDWELNADPEWSTEGEKNVLVGAWDSAENPLTNEYTYTVDETSPDVFITNYTRNGWIGSNITVGLNATDNMNMSVISYGTYSEGSSNRDLDRNSIPGENVTVDVGCEQGQVCEKRIIFNGNDSAGNHYVEAYDESELVTIDKRAPDIGIASPPNETLSAGIQINASISDLGVGTGDASFAVVNSSNPSQTFVSGDLNESSNWIYNWSSESDIQEAEKVVLSVTAEDQLGQERTVERTFTVENQRATVSILSPTDAVVGEDFQLGIRGSRPGVIENLTQHNYSIERDGEEILGRETVGLDTNAHLYSTQLDTSQLEGDGNYTLNTAVRSESGEFATSETEFYLDTRPPEVSITSSSLNQSWVTGDDLEIEFEASDKIRNDTIFWRYRHGSGDWTRFTNIEFGDSSFSFDTSLCPDSSDADCQVEIVAEDSVGNRNSSMIELRVDNSPPNVDINSPSSGSWHRNDFTVSRAAGDNVVGTEDLACRVKVGSSGWTDRTSLCADSFTVDISENCQVEDEDSCRVQVEAENPAGLVSTAERYYSIDTEEPVITSAPEPSPTSIINGSEQISLSFEDRTSGVQYSTWGDGKTVNSFDSGDSFEPGWTESGNKSLEIVLNDSANNLRTENYEYTFDNRAPEIKNVNLSVAEDEYFNEVRAYRKQDIRLKVNLTENIEMEEVKATVKKDSKTNISLNLISGGLENGTWGKNLANDSTGLYNITAVYARDRAGNTTVVNSDLPSFKVVNYSENIVLGDDRTMNAGYTRPFNYSVDFNRTQGTRHLQLFIPPSRPGELSSSYFNFTDVSCNRQNCSIEDNETFIDLRYNGSQPEVNLTGNVTAAMPENDLTDTFRTVLAGNVRSSSANILAPDLSVANGSCSPDCSVNQSQAFNLSFDTLNNGSMSNSGEAREVSLEAGAESVNNSTEVFGDVSSGEMNDETFRNFSIGTVGNYTVEAVLEDATGDYRDKESVEVEVLDSENPVLENVAPGSQRININGSVDLTANISDNVGVVEANLTLSYPNGTEKKLALEEGSEDRWEAEFSNTSERGIYTLETVEASDQRGNTLTEEVGENFKVTELRLNTSVNRDNITTGDPVNFTADITGNSSAVGSVTLNVTKPKEENEIVEYTDVGLNNTLAYDGFINSGNYSFEVTAEAGLSVSNSTSDTFVRFGNSSLRPLAGNSSTLVLPDDVDPVNLSWGIRPVNGSLRNISVQTSSTDTSVLEFIEDEKQIGNITYSDGEAVEGTLASPEGLGGANITVSIDPEKGAENSAQLQVRIKESDQRPPVLDNFSLSEKKLNLDEGLEFSADITDNSVVRNATLVVRHPENGSNITERFKMDREGRTDFAHEFENTSEIGNYSFMLKAWDIEGNSVNRTGNFSVTDKYTVEAVQDQQMYVKGDSPLFSVNVYDANGEKIDNYDLDGALDRAGNNISISSEDVEVTRSQGSIDSIRYLTIEEEDPPAADAEPDQVPMDYRLHLNVSNGENRGQLVENVPVTRLLDIEWGVSEDFIEPGGEFTIEAEWSEPYNDEVGGALFSYVNCRACSPSFKEFNPVGDDRFNTTLTAPNETGEIQVQAIAFDSNGNAESQELGQRPELELNIGGAGVSPNNTAPEGGFGGVSGGGGPSMEISRVSPDVSIPPSREEVELAVNTNIAAQCVYSSNSIPQSVSFQEASNFTETGGVNHSATIELDDRTTYSYSVMCASENVNSTQDVIFSTESLQTFTFTAPTSLTPGNESVTQFGNSSGRLVVYNDQNTDMTVDFGIESDCCNLSVVRNSEDVESVAIPSGSERTLQLSAYSPLYVEPGTYDGTLMLSTVNDSSSHPFSFQVSPHPAVQNFTDLETRAELLNSTISRYSIAGIDTSNMREGFQNLTQHLDEANQSIQRNDLEGLISAVEEGRHDASRIDQMLEDASFKKYVLLNWWKWAAAFVVLYIVFFLVVMVGIPYYRIQTELTRINSQLDSAIDARKKGEKQYFQRKIDKDTFSEMMTERQNEVLQLRGQKEDLKEELDGFLWEKLTLENYLKAPWKGMNELEKWWAANRRARENLNRKDEDEE